MVHDDLRMVVTTLAAPMHESPHALERLLSKLVQNINKVLREDTHVTVTWPNEVRRLGAPEGITNRA